MTTCDRSDHDHKSLTASALCAALDELAGELPGASEKGGDFFDGADWAMRRLRADLDAADKATRP